MAALAIQPPSKNAEEDPLQQDDPWKQYQTPVKSAKTGPPSVFDPNRTDQFAESIVNKVTQRIQDQQKLRAIPLDDGDTPMGGTDRLQDLEARMLSIEDAMQHQQNQQHQHNQEVANQIGKIQSQMDSQAATLQNHLDTKMSEQLAHIERLLSKKSRTE